MEVRLSGAWHAADPLGRSRLARLAALLLAFVAASGSPVRAAGSEARLAMLTTTVNGVPAGDAVLVVTDSDVLMEVTALERAGIRLASGRRHQVDDRTFVSLRTLEPDVSFEIDYAELVLRLTVAPAVLGTTIVPPRRGAADRPISASSSAFVNYAVNWRQQAGVDLFGEAGVTFGRGVATTTVFDAPSGGLVRGLTQAVIDDRRRLTRWTLGDRVVGGGELGGAILLGGVAATREYGIDPGYVNYSTVNFAGTAAAPSIVEVYANGQLVDTHRLPAGQFELKGLPVTSGRGEARVVVRDMFGRRQEFGAPYYVTSAVLAKGLHDYAYAVGVQRDDLGTENWNYSRPAALARHRVGVTDWLTAGVRVEASERLVSGGPSLNLRFPLGELELGLGASRDAGNARGAAGMVGYRYVGRRVNFGAVVRSVGRSYRALGTRYDTRFGVREADLSAAVRLGRATVSLRHVQTSDSTILGASRTAVSISARIAAHADAFVTVNRYDGRSRGTSMVVGLSRVLGRRSGANVTHDAAPGRRGTTSAEIARSLPVGTGVGYRLRMLDSPQRQASGIVEYQGDRGRYEASMGMAGSGSGAAVGASGALVVIGGGVHATRTVQDAYALVRVPGAANVRVYAHQQEIGRTGRDGTLLVPNLLSYSTNELTIADTDVPLTTALESGGRLVVPGYRGASIVQFPVRNARPSVGRIELITESGPVVPFAGELTVRTAGGTVSSPIGRAGDFYLEGLPEGSHAATVEWYGQRCELTLRVEAGGSQDLGTVQCAARKGGS